MIKKIVIFRLIYFCHCNIVKDSSWGEGEGGLESKRKFKAGIMHEISNETG